MKKILLSCVMLISLVLLAGCADLFKSNDGPFLITFESNGGTPVEDITVEVFDPFLPPSVPVKEGYVFGGWYIDEDLYYPMSFQTGTNQPLTLYAKWIQIGELLDEDMIIDAILQEMDVMALFEEEIQKLITSIQPSVVLIDAYNGANIETSGSGVIFHHDQHTYYVLTNEHVIQGYAAHDVALTIFLNDETLEISKGDVTLHGQSVLHDLAVISFTSSEVIPVMTFADPDQVGVGNLVFSLGHPLDLPQTIDLGLISSTNREINDGMGMDTIMIQHSSAINPGMSGGALVNIRGELVGINTMSYVDEVVGEGIEDLHFAVSIDVILDIIDTLY